MTFQHEVPQSRQSLTPPGSPARGSSYDEEEERMMLVSLDESSSSSASSFTDLVVRAASMCNRMVVEKCGMCTVYCDAQIRDELHAAARSPSTTTTTTLWMMNSLYDTMEEEVQAARQFLFDETSVVDSISDRS